MGFISRLLFLTFFVVTETAPKVSFNFLWMLEGLVVVRITQSYQFPRKLFRFWISSCKVRHLPRECILLKRWFRSLFSRALLRFDTVKNIHFPLTFPKPPQLHQSPTTKTILILKPSILNCREKSPKEYSTSSSNDR